MKPAAPKKDPHAAPVAAAGHSVMPPAVPARAAEMTPVIATNSLAADAHLVERGLTGTQAYRGGFLDVRRDRVASPDGGTTEREYIVHPGAAAIVPILDDGRLVMVRQYRYPIGQVMLEFPAGKLDAGEPGIDCAMRELAEETGYHAAEWARGGLFHNAIAYSTEGLEIWFARGLTAGKINLDQGEFVDVVLFSEQDLDAIVRDGTVTDAKTLIGLFWLKEWRAGRWPLAWKAAPTLLARESDRGG